MVAVAQDYENISSTVDGGIAEQAKFSQRQPVGKVLTRAIAVVLAVTTVAALLFAANCAPHNGPSLRSSLEAVTDLVLLTKPCAKMWGQCGGEGYSGPTCCEEGGECVDYALDNFPSYQQCRVPAPPACADLVPGSVCFDKIQKAKGNVWAHPEFYHGLTPESEDKEFQMMFHWAEHDTSQCQEPCGPGTCYMSLHVIGCDTLNTWYCEHDDGTVKYACCCKYFNAETALDKPHDVDAEMANAMEAVGSDSPTLYCTTMVLPHGYELNLLREQYQQGKLGLFDCNWFSLFSNESLTISPVGEHPVIKTGLINGSLTASMGGHWHTALNTGVFIKFWDKVLEDPKAWKSDFVVKVDPDTMWLPVRLRALLRTTIGPLGQPEPPAGLFLNNCHVGMHGPIEVLSHRALRTYRKGREECATGKPSKIGQEDWFLRECFEELGILKVDAFNLMLEATLACQEVASVLNPDRPPCFAPQVAFHPFKSVHTWMRCHKEAANHPWALPAVPVTDGPSEANEFHA